MTILLRYFKGLTQEQTARILGVSPGAGIPAGAPGPETAAIDIRIAPWNSVMVFQYRLGMWVMRQRGFSRSRMAMVS